MTLQTDSMASYSETFCAHKSNFADKWECYLPVYDQLFSRIKDKCSRLLEVGINAGGSLEVYAKYFNKAEAIVGIDINQDCAQIKFNDPRIALFIGDATQDNARIALKNSFQLFDLIIDDGSHQSIDIIRAFLNLVGLLAPGGVYVVEDLHCSYWSEFKGGLKHPMSAIAFFKRLIDIINQEHWNSGLTVLQYLCEFGIQEISAEALERIGTIQGIEFYNSICIVKFAQYSRERLIGRRICRGAVASAGYTPVNGMEIANVGLGSDQTANPFNLAG